MTEAHCSKTESPMSSQIPCPLPTLPLAGRVARGQSRSLAMTRNTTRRTVKLATAWSVATLLVAAALAQDVPGIEICTRESRLDRRTSCLQSNVEFLQQVVTKNALDAAQKLSAANREIAALKEQLAAANRDLAALKDALSAMEAKMEQLPRSAPRPAPDAKPQGK
jgi:septal ring factor EnvC (AmiA/AmiB activator)